MTYHQRHREVLFYETLHAEVAEYRLRHEGIKPELIRYLAGIGEAFR